MEFNVFKLPKPDLVIFLDVPYEISKKWLQGKVNQMSKKYLKGKKDVAEDNLRHLKLSRDSALLLAQKNKNWSKIECCKGSICMSPPEVSKNVFKIVSKRLKI